MWKNILDPGRAKKTIWRTRIACWIPKARNTHSKYVILTAFSLQQLLHERVSTLHYTYSTLPIYVQYTTYLRTVHCLSTYSTLPIYVQ
jgi:hypothetical protein